MGARAFIMAEFLGIPYTDVMIAAFIPAIVYFAGVWAGICVEAKRLGLGRIPLELLPKAKEIFLSREMMAFVISLGVLIYLLLLYLPPQELCCLGTDSGYGSCFCSPVVHSPRKHSGSGSR